MKLRLQHNSVRLRLKRSEVAQLIETGRVEERIIFSAKPERILVYVLELVETDQAPSAELDADVVRVRLSAARARSWAGRDDEVGIEEHQPLTPDHCLHILVEKDFACLDRSDEQNADTYPHPLADQV